MKNKFLHVFCIVLIKCFVPNSCDAQVAEWQDNLLRFAKVFGYVKYYHPNGFESQTEWNRFARMASEKIFKLDSSKDIDSVLTELFRPVTTGMIIRRGIDGDEFDCIKEVGPPDDSVVFWQHRGCGLDLVQPSPFYKSALVNSFTPKFQNTIGSYAKSASLKEVDTAQFKVRVRARLLNGEQKCHGQLWLRTQTTNKKNLKFINLPHAIISREWRDYELSMTLDSNARNIATGCYLQGSGELQIDFIRVSLYKEGSWHPFDELTNEFSTPTLDTANQNWLFSGPGYAIESGQAGKESYLKIVYLNEYVRAQPLHSHLLLCETQLIIDLDKNIYCELPIGLNQDDFAELSLRSKKYSQMYATQLPSPNLQDSFWRLADLISAWNIYEHFYPELEQSESDRQISLKQAFQNCLDDTSTHDFYLTLRALLSVFRDGHFNAYHISGTRTFYPKISWRFIGHQLCLTGVFDSTLNIKPGDIVTKINAQPVEMLRDSVMQFISGSTENRRLLNLADFLLAGYDGEQMNIEVNGLLQLSLNKTQPHQAYKALKQSTQDTLWIKGHVGYVNLKLITMDKFYREFKNLEKCEALIFDLRGYANSNHGILSHLLDENDTCNSWLRTPQTVFPKQCSSPSYYSAGWLLRSDSSQFESKIFFLINEEAISYSEGLLTIVQGYDLGELVGTPSAGTNGNVANFRLSTGFIIVMTGMTSKLLDGSDLFGKGIQPNHVITPSIEGLKANRDEVLEYTVGLTEK